MISKELLSKTDFEVLNNIQAELDETFKKVQVHRTRTEMEVSVLNDLKFPTPASKYWQAMREQNVMLSGVTALSFEYRMEKVRLKKIIRKMLKTEDKLDKELLQIKKEKKEYILKEMERSAAHKVREILEWSDIKNREASVMSKEDQDLAILALYMTSQTARS